MQAQQVDTLRRRSRLHAAGLESEVSASGGTKHRDRRSPVARLRYLRDATLHLVGRELTARYRRSLLGWLWSLAPPLMQLAVFHFVFTRVIPLDVPNFALFLLTGILAWSFFAAGVSLATASLEARRDLVRRPGFPTFLLPVVAVLVGFVDYLFALPVLLLAVGFEVGLGPEALLLPVLVAMQLVLACGLGWLLAPLHVFFRDVQHFVGIVLTLGFWLTPIFYTRASVPPGFSLIYDLNPMAHLVEAQRAVLLDGVWPSPVPLALVGGAAVAVLAAGATVFAACHRSIPEQL